MPRRTRIALVGKIEAWEAQTREGELKELLSVLRCEWFQRLMDPATEDLPQDEADDPTGLTVQYS